MEPSSFGEYCNIGFLCPVSYTHLDVYKRQFLAFNVHLIRLFVQDPLTITMASSYLIVLAFSQVFSTMEVITNGLFTGIGKPHIPSIISVVFTSLRLPFALFLTIPFGVNGIWMSISLSSMLKGIVAYLVYKIRIRKEFA